MSSPSAPTNTSFKNTNSMNNNNDTPSQGIKRTAPIDRSSTPTKKSTFAQEEDSDDDYVDSDDSLPDLDNSDDLTDEDDDDDDALLGEENGEHGEPLETEEDKLQRAMIAKEQGNEHFRAKQYDQALLCYDEAVTAAPLNATYLNNRAATHLQLSHYDSAVSGKFLPNYSQ